MVSHRGALAQLMPAAKSLKASKFAPAGHAMTSS